MPNAPRVRAPGRDRMIRRIVLASGAAVVAYGLAAGSPAAQTLTGREIRDLFTENTVAGVYVNGGPFSEYHAADGRALGDNGRTFNIDACWNTDKDNVCYHYGPAKDRRTYCFTVEKNGDSLTLRVADSGRLNAVASVEKGNPGGHNDGGRRWSCDDLMSKAPGASRLARIK